VSLDIQPLRQRDGMAALLAALGEEDGDVRFVGGCVRDGLLGAAVNDVDLATRLQPAQVIARLKGAGIRAVPTGIDHGTVTAVIAGGPVEVTTLRRDVSTDGRRATVAFTDDWREDAARRDFTINALSSDPRTGAVHDYFDGLADLATRTVRFIGDPRQRIAEDHLRILRFFRFHARFGRGDPDAGSLEACLERANDLMALSRERIADELLKLLALPSPAPTVRLMMSGGIFAPVLPEVVEDAAERVERLIAAEAAAGLAPDPLRRLAAMLPSDPDIAAAVGTRLRLSNKAVKRLVLATGGAIEASPAILAYRIGAVEAQDRFLLGGDAEAAASLTGWQRPRLAVSGGDLIAMGLTPGPVVAATIQALERQWGAENYPPDPLRQRAIAAMLVDQALRDT
jgi:poly(A) polymerase